MATFNQYTGDGTTVLFSFTFPYISEADVKASIDGVVSVPTTEYIFANATTIQFLTPPPDQSVIRIYRETPVDDVEATFFPGSAIRAADLNGNFTQTLYVTQEAVERIGGAVTDASNAVTLANQAQTDATTAVSTANTATTTANNAETTANNAVSTANSAVTTANSAASTATSAQAAADTALATVSQALSYTLVANVAAIPGAPQDNDAVEVTDSTGIESFTPLQGLPGGFVGESGLYVRLVYSSGSSSWVYQAYGASDPESRYISTSDVINSVTSTSTGQPGSANAVKTAYDQATTALGDAATASSTATQAQADATQALADAAAAAGTASQAQSDATQAQTTADAALPKAGGTMTGTITFANGQTIQGYALLTTSQTFTAAQRGSVDALVSGATVAINLADSNNFSLTLTTNATLDAPTNVTAGQSGVIVITQDGTGSRTLAYNTIYKFPGGAVPSLSIAGGSVDVLAYYVESATRITCRLIQDVK